MKILMLSMCGAGETATLESAREVCGSECAGKEPKEGVWGNDEVKAAFERKEATWKDVRSKR